jgi:hypothetical protein
MVCFLAVPDPGYFDPSEYEQPPVADLEWFAQHTNGNAALESGWIARPLASVSDEPPVAPELALGILYPGKRHVFSGPQESAKTLAAYVCGLEVVRAGQTIVLVDFEMGEYDAKRRMRELGATDDELEAIAYVEPQSPATALAIERLISTEPALVIVDAAAGAFQVEGLDDNSRRDVEVWAQSWVNPFWRAQIATLVLDHVTKNAETRGNYAIGSERKVGGVDVHIGFSVIHPISRGGSGRYKVTTHKDRGGFLKRGKLAEFALRSDPETHALSCSLEPFVESDETHRFRPTGIMEKVSRWLELQPDPVSRNLVENAKLGSREYVRIALDVLVDEGYLGASEGPRKARLVEVIRVYREDSDDFAATSPDFAENADQSHLATSPHPLRGGEAWRGGDPAAGEVAEGTTSPQSEIEF